MYTTQRKKEKKLIVEAIKPRNEELHMARFNRKAGRIQEKRPARGAERRESIQDSV